MGKRPKYKNQNYKISRRKHRGKALGHWNWQCILGKNTKSKGKRNNRQMELGWPKSSFSFKVKLKDTFFIFINNFLKQHYSLFCSTTFCHLSGNFIIPSSQNFLSFWAKKCSKCLLQSSRELKFFPLTEFCKDQNKWKSAGAVSGE